MQSKEGCGLERGLALFPYLPVSDESAPQLQENMKSRDWETLPAWAIVRRIGRGRGRWETNFTKRVSLLEGTSIFRIFRHPGSNVAWSG